MIHAGWHFISEQSGYSRNLIFQHCSFCATSLLLPGQTGSYTAICSTPLIGNWPFKAFDRKNVEKKKKSGKQSMLTASLLSRKELEILKWRKQQAVCSDGSFRHKSPFHPKDVPTELRIQKKKFASPLVTISLATLSPCKCHSDFTLF